MRISQPIRSVHNQLTCRRVGMIPAVVHALAARMGAEVCLCPGCLAGTVPSPCTGSSVASDKFSMKSY